MNLQYVIFTKRVIEILRKKMKRNRKISKLRKQNNNVGRQSFLKFSVLGEGLEPSRTEVHRILSPVRLPIPPSEQSQLTDKKHKISYNFDFLKIFLINFLNSLDKKIFRFDLN